MRHLSLFTGSGIGTLAAAECGIKTIAQCENDPACQYALRKLWPDAHLFEDIRNVTASALRDYMPIDIISGGFPCQDLSPAGRGAGIEGSRSGLWREMFRVIRQVRPRWLLVENVPAIRLRGVDRVIAPLARIGYTCWPLVVGSEAVGGDIPRRRLWIIARTASGRLQKRLVQEQVLQRVSQIESAVRLHTYGGLCSTRKTRSEVFTAFPVETDGLAGGLLRAARNSLLRILGNAWCYPLSVLMFQAIVELDRLTLPNPQPPTGRR